MYMWSSRLLEDAVSILRQPNTPPPPPPFPKKKKKKRPRDYQQPATRVAFTQCARMHDIRKKKKERATQPVAHVCLCACVCTHAEPTPWNLQVIKSSSTTPCVWWARQASRNGKRMREEQKRRKETKKKKERGTNKHLGTPPKEKHPNTFTYIHVHSRTYTLNMQSAHIKSTGPAAAGQMCCGCNAAARRREGERENSSPCSTAPLPDYLPNYLILTYLYCSSIKTVPNGAHTNRSLEHVGGAVRRPLPH